MRKMRSGFTTAELIVVLLVISGMMVVLLQGIPALLGWYNSTRLATQLQNLTRAMEKYYADTGTYPCNVKYLVHNPSKDNPTGNTLEKCYDAISLVAGSEQDQDVLAHWSGPYIDGVEFVAGSNDNLIRAVFGQSIGIGATITDGKVTPIAPTGTVNQGGGGQYMNVLVVSGLQADQVKEAYKTINGNSIDGTKAYEALKAGGGGGTEGFSDALNVAKGETTYKFGVPKTSQTETLYTVFRYTHDYSGQN